VTGNAWPTPALVTISFVPDGTQVTGGATSNLFAQFNSHPGWTTATWQKIILKAAQSWAQQTNINFALVADNGAPMGSGNYQQGDPNMGDIRIGGYNFGSGNNTLALAIQPPPANNYSAAGDITFNTAQPFNVGSTYDLYTVAAHEIGHALGLDESNVPQAIMYGTYTCVKNGLNSDDVTGIRTIYSGGNARTPDVYAGNQSFATAANVSSQINPVALTALLPNLDLTSINGSTGARTYTENDYFTFVAPSATGSTLTVQVQSTGLSLLSPTVTVYAANETTVLASASGANQYGATIDATVTGVTPGEQFYVKVSGAETTTLGSGRYALALNFGTGATPTEASPVTQLANGNPLVAGGGDPELAPAGRGTGEVQVLANDHPVPTTPATGLGTGRQDQAAPVAPNTLVVFVPVTVTQGIVPSGEGHVGDALTLTPRWDEQTPGAVPAPEAASASPEGKTDQPLESTAVRQWVQAGDAVFAETATAESEDGSNAALFTEDGAPARLSAAALAALAAGLGGWWAEPRDEVRGLQRVLGRVRV
jgi:hypothetical protein